MAVNFDDYLSTSVRWAMFKADWPDATVVFTEGTAEEAGIPSSFSKKEEKVCIATVTRHGDDNRPIVAYKTFSDAKGRDTDSWHALCSKAMGRALKKAGYPDTIDDLKILMRFREAIGTAQKIEPKQVPQVETKAALIAGQAVTQPTLPIESKEQPVKPTFDWRTESERDEAHRLFKQMCADLSPDELESMREVHEKLNSRMWPMPKAELNNLIVNLEGLKTARKGKNDSIETSVLVSMFHFLSSKAQDIVSERFGKPETWPEKVSEAEYNTMMDVFETASEAE